MTLELGLIFFNISLIIGLVIYTNWLSNQDRPRPERRQS